MYVDVDCDVIGNVVVDGVELLVEDVGGVV